MVASDRICAFDVVFAEPIPDKGRVLTAMTAFWCEELADLAPSSLVTADPADIVAWVPAAAAFATAEGTASPAGPCWCAGPRCCRLECIVRGYLAGQAYDEYAVSGHRARHAPAARAAAGRPAARADVHPVDQGRRGPRR